MGLMTQEILQPKTIFISINGVFSTDLFCLETGLLSSGATQLTRPRSFEIRFDAARGVVLPNERVPNSFLGRMLRIASITTA
jgi:hypothetical protein